MADPKFTFRGIISRRNPSSEAVNVSIYLIEESPRGEYFVGKSQIGTGDATMPFPALINKVEVVEKAFRYWVISGQFWEEPKLSNCLKAMLSVAREQYLEGLVSSALLFSVVVLNVGNDYVDFVFG